MSIETAERFLDITAVKERTTFSKPTIYAYINDPHQNFPAPVRIGLRRVVWLASEVDKWMANKVRNSRKVAA
jgi:predicted DNA-binding transcriptional regulator AlpA